MKLFKFTLNIYLRHFIAVFIAIVMFIPLYQMAANQQYLFSTFTGCIYFALCYNIGWKYGMKDGRKIREFYPDYLLPVKASLLAMILPAAMIIIKAVLPELWRVNIPIIRGDVEFFIKGCYINGMPDLIYRMYQLPIAGFIPSQNVLAYFAFLLPEAVFVTLGYFVGTKRFSVMEYISAKLVFGSSADKRKKEDKFRR